MNWGAFAGGAAKGISQGINDSRTMQKLNREKKEAELEDAWREEQKALAEKYFPTQVETQQDGAQQGQQPGQQQQVPQPQVDGGGTQPAQQVQGDSGGGPSSSQGGKPSFNSMADAINFATEGAKINMKYGKSSPGDFVNLMKIKQTFQKEGMDEAIGRLHGGDFQGALAAYNRSGDDRVEYKGAPQQGLFEFAGQKIPTMIATVVGSDGQERTINTAQIMASKIGLDKTVDLLHKNLDSSESRGLQRDQLTEQNRHNVAMEGIQSRTKEDSRGTVGKDYDDLARIYGPEQAAQMVGGKYGKKEVTDYQRVQALDKIQEIISQDGGVTDQNASQVNAMLRSIGEPAHERVLDQPEEKNYIRPNKPATYKWIPGTRVEGDGTPQVRRSPVTGGIGNNVGGMRPNGQSTGFQSFDTTEDGLKAVDNNLKSYGEKRGIDTLAGVISTWSPESDGNNTKKLIEDASRVTGLKPDQKIDLSNPAVRTVVAAAIIRQEGSQSYLTGIGNGKRPIGEAPPKSPVAGGLGNYGKRNDGTDKGGGFLGEQQMQDGSGKVATEISIGVNIGGKDVEIPTLLPTLTPEEKNYLLKGGDPRQSEGIMKKAVDHAKQRIAAGKSPFQEKPAIPEQLDKNSAPAEKKSSFWTDPNNPLAGSIDIGSAFGKPIAAVGEMVGKDVAATADLFKAIAEMSPDTQSVLMESFMKYPDMAVKANKVLTEEGIEGLKWWVSQMNPAKNTEDHMQRTSSKNLNQYFR